MYSRLLIARTLLKEDGVIFISIDDREVYHLRKLCNEIFGEENFLGNIVRSTGQTTGQDSGGLGSSFDFIMAYSKNQVFLSGLELNEHDLSRFDNEDENGKFAYDQMRKTGSNDKREDRPKLFYPVKNPDGEDCLPIAPAGYESCWRFEKKTYEKLNSENYILWKKSKREGGEIWWPYVKYYLEGRTKRPSPLWTDLDGNKKAARDLKSLFNGQKVFDFPKPIQLIQRLALIAPDAGPNDIILDFFSGSGAAGEAILKLNEEESGNRKFILVQLPETTDPKSEAHKAGYKKISDITIERNKRVIEKIIEVKKAEQPDLFTDDKKDDSLQGLGFKVFKLQKSNFPRTEFAPDPEKSEEENVELLKKYIRDKEAQMVTAFNKDELITEILIKKGYELNYTVSKKEEFKKNELFYVTDGNKETLICLDGALDKETVEYFKQNPKENLIVLERALDTTKKWNLKHYMGDNFVAF